MSYCIYILESLKNKSYYIGVTKNLNKRIREHNAGLSKSTAPKRPFKLIYSENFDNTKEAYKREKYLKSLKKRVYIEKMIKGYNLPG